MAMVSMHAAAHTNHVVPDAIFVFGDSTVDVGTNNFLKGTGARANFRYNGIDFPHSTPTGRFSNGFNVADQIARLFGYKESPPPFLLLKKHRSSFKKQILRGANFASAGSGILNTTGILQWHEVVSFEKQIEQFSEVRGKIKETMGSEAATSSLLSKSLFLISIGSNDLFDYQRNTSTIHPSKNKYLATLQLLFYLHLRNLYDLGARKFGIISVPPLGCCPAERALNKKGDCLVEMNEFAHNLNLVIENILKDMLSIELKGMKYSLGNSYEMTMNILEDPLAFGLKDIKDACCGGGRFNGESPCYELLKPNLCKDRRKYLFWDFYHPTEHASELAALTLYGGRGGSKLVSPINFKQLFRI